MTASSTLAPATTRRQAYARGHYERNKPKYVARARAWNIENRKRVRALIAEWRETHPCVDCGEPDPIVLDFDHVRGEKRCDVTNAAALGLSVESTRAEIAKCDMRCANCHRRKTRRAIGGSIPPPASK